MDDLERKRAVLLDARFRFSPHVQPIKESAIDSIVQQVLFIHRDTTGLTVQVIQSQYTSMADGASLNISDVRGALKRLGEAGCVVGHGARPRRRYQLTDEASQQITNTLGESESRSRRVLEELFKHEKGGAEFYDRPFRACVVKIIFTVIEESIHWVLGEADTTSDPASLNEAARGTVRQFPDVNYDVLRSGVSRFFREANPDFDAMKWNLAQGYYVLRAIGMHDSSRLLTTEIFEGAELYLDTNVLVKILDNSSSEYHAFERFVIACKDAGISVKVCRPNLDELANLIGRWYEEVNRLADSIPPELVERVDSVFLERYSDLQSKGVTPSFAEVAGDFANPEQCLTNHFGIAIVDDAWFTDPANYTAVESLANQLVARTRSRPKGPKTFGSALTDANVLLWIGQQPSSSARNLLVSLDRSLLGVVPPGSNTESIAIPLSAMLLWISPMSQSISCNGSVSDIFVRLMQERVLPQDPILNLHDFLVLHEMGVQTKNLPADDVERLIRVIRSVSGHVDPSEPDGREKLAREIQRFFVDPDTKANREVARLREKATRLEEENERLRAESLRTIDEKNLKIKQLEEDADVERRRIQEETEKQAEEQRTTEHRQRLRKSALKRLSFIGVALICWWLFTGWLAETYGDSQSRIQNLGQFWFLIVLGPTLAVGASWFVVGRDGLESLGWAVSRLFRTDGQT